MQTQAVPAQLLRLPAVIQRTGLSRSSIYRHEAEGTFPRRVKIGASASAWLASDIDRWITGRVIASRGQQ
ncbi:helix-turn-helix transcriptional regulator [Rhodanobacter thiooxydans]|uniref:helix-turn-helix transcriptional regulator n=1 Tax=Rhodanobacter thiooxydans TaxID=416169 RepID=UPI000D3AF58A|nr:AlpA family transcriptional regulator [Rhodanobacter thiooxydans]